MLAVASARRYNSSIGNAVRSAGRATRQQQSQSDPKAHVRHFSKTGTARFLQGVGGGTSTQPYFVVAATERIFKICGEQASYRISEAERKDGVRKLDDGEEVGHSTAKGSIWHETFKLPPTFSTWSHVTMLHLYLLNARIRQFDREAYRRWQQQLVDHFFFEAEKKMHIDHNITSSALRQRYLKDIFVQWRGLLLAYDEGLIKGDAILASALWRNLFKGNPDVDPRALASIVGWMRASLKALEATSDYTFPSRATDILSVPVMNFWKALEKTCGAVSITDGVPSPERESVDPEPENIRETAKPVTPAAAKVAKP
jgi:cytochrome b pre-mRNA-processing protein 3